MRRAWALALGAGVAAGGACGQTTAEVLFEREQLKIYATNAQSYYEAGDLPRAEHQCRRALSLDAAYTKAQALLGYVLFQRAQGLSGDARTPLLDEAEDLLVAVTKDAAKTDVNVFKSYFGLGMLAMLRARDDGRLARGMSAALARGEGGHTDADIAAVRARERESAELAVRHYKNAVLTSLERFDQAREGLAEALAYVDRRVEAVEQLDLLIEKVQASEQVKAEQKQGLAADKTLDPGARNARLLEFEKHLRDLRVWIVRLLDLKAVLLGQDKQYARAREVLRSALLREPDYSLLHYNLALVEAAMGERGAALESLQKFLALRETAGRKLEAERSRLAAEHAPRAAQEEIARRVAEVRTDRERVGLFSGVLHAREGHHAEAATALAAALQEIPDSVAVPLHGAIRALGRAQYADAQGLLTRFLEDLRRRGIEWPEIRAEVQALLELVAERAGRAAGRPPKKP